MIIKPTELPFAWFVPIHVDQEIDLLIACLSALWFARQLKRCYVTAIDVIAFLGCMFFYRICHICHQMKKLVQTIFTTYNDEDDKWWGCNDDEDGDDVKRDKKTGFQQKLCQVIDFKSEHVITILRYLVKSQYVHVIVIVGSLIF